MVATILLRSKTLALAGVVILSGCVTAPPVPDDYCSISCQQELREQRLEALRGRTYNTHLSQEYRDAMAQSRQQAARWAAKDPGRRITTAGPDLAAYGLVGSAGYMEVAECKNDVVRAVKDLKKRELFDRMCYDLLPVQHREKFYANDRRVPSYDPPVIIVVPVERPQSIPRNRGYIECCHPGSLR